MSALGRMGLMTHAETPIRRFARYAITFARLNLACVLFVLWG